MRYCARSLVAALILAGCALPSSLSAQQPTSTLPADSTADSLLTAGQRWLTADLLTRLPLDRLDEALSLLAGVVADDNRLLVRGGQFQTTGWYVDGVPATPGLRGAGPSYGTPTLLSAGRGWPEGGLNGLARATVETGPASAGLGDGQAGFVKLETRPGAERWRALLDYRNDQTLGGFGVPGYSRIAVSGGGPLARGLRFSLAGVLSGQHSIAAGKDGRDAPLFVAAGVDTTMRFARIPGDPFSDTLTVDVASFAVSRGACEDFSASANAAIASNYGLECQGVRLPASALSAGQAVGRVDYQPDGRTSLRLSLVANQDQRRNFDYLNLYNPSQLSADRATSQILTLGLTRQLGRLAGGPAGIDAFLSYQHERALHGPLTAAGELDSRNPAGGFLLAPLDFQFGFADFPVDDELVANYRRNAPGTRRSPYDLENPSQYALIDNYRNNAYGLTGFSEGGGPTGRLVLANEGRWVGGATLALRPAPSHGVRLGLEAARYDVSFYSHQLTSQAFSDVYREQPVRLALFAEDRLVTGDLALTVGLRYDRFDSRAARPLFPRIYSDPGFDPADPTAGFVPDEAHSSVSPRLQAVFRAGPATAIRAGYARLAQMPDFGVLFAGINTDLSITSSTHVFGSDLRFARTDLVEVGVQHRLTGGLELDLSVYHRDLEDQVIIGQARLRDPLRGSDVDISQFINAGNAEVLGLDLGLRHRLSSAADIGVVYGYQRVERQGGLVTEESRPHRFTGHALLRVPDGWRAGSVLGRALATAELAVTFHATSGRPYTRCTDPAALAGDLCLPVAELNDQRLPAQSRLDLRLGRSFDVAGRRLTAYIDGRNMLSRSNVRTVFAATGNSTSPADLDAAWRSDSAAFWTEARRNFGVADFTTGALNLTFGGASAAGCGNWRRSDDVLAPPNCVYLIRAEERWGDGDGIFTVAEQRRASEAFYRTRRGTATFFGPGRVVRVGLSLAL